MNLKRIIQTLLTQTETPIRGMNTNCMFSIRNNDTSDPFSITFIYTSGRNRLNADSITNPQFVYKFGIVIVVWIVPTIYLTYFFYHVFSDGFIIVTLFVFF